MPAVHSENNPENITPVRLTGNLLLNVFLLPVYVLLGIVCLCLALSNIFPARVARDNFKNRLHLNAFERTLATAATLFHYCLVAIEDFVFWPLGVITIRNNPQKSEEMLQASLLAKQQQRGLVVLSAHFGNIEVTAQCLTSLLCGQITANKRLIALAKPSRSALMTRILGWYRDKRGIEVLWTHRKDFIKAMILALKEGRALALLVDQKPSTAGHFVNFFGAQSAFPDGGIEIGMRAKAEFVFVTSRRLWPGVYTFEALHVPSHESLQASSILTSYASWLESVIKMSPWQWCWDYKKWSRKPKHEAQA